jgi:hypothetical protein
MIKNSLFYISCLLVFTAVAQQGPEQKQVSSWSWKKKTLYAIGTVAVCGYMLAQHAKKHCIPDLGQIVTSAN